MIQVFRKLIPGHPDGFGFRFNEEVFLPGMKLSGREKYPWKNSGEMKKFFEQLYMHKSADSYQKIIEWKTVLHQERTHVSYSWALILRVLSLLMIPASGVLFLFGQPLIAEILLGSGFVLLIAHVALRRRASTSSHSWSVITDLLKTLIAQQAMKQEKAA
jgi:hypothetical protein